MSRGLALAVLLVGCGRPDLLPPHPQPLPPLPPRSQPARVWRVEDRAERARPGGPLVEAREGDFLIVNQRLAASVAGLAGSAPGALLDAALPGGRDALRSITPVVGVNPAAPRLVRAELEHLGGAATLRLRGHDVAAPSLEVAVEYSLHPGSSRLRLVTTVRNRGSHAVPGYKLGDRLEWGAAEPFLPGLGLLARPRACGSAGPGPGPAPALQTDWMGAVSSGASYLYSRQTPLAVEICGSSALVLLASADLPGGGEISTSRALGVSDGGGLTALLSELFAARGTPTGLVELSIHTDEGEPLPGATVEIQRGGLPFAVGRSGEDGSLRLRLPGGRYRLRARSADRLGPPQEVAVETSLAIALRLRLGPPSQLLFEVRDAETAALVPARLVLAGLDGTPTPWLGPAHETAAHNHLLSATGRGSLPLPPGRYRVLVTRGPEHSIHDEALTLRPHTGGGLVARLRKVVDSSGYLAVDPGEPARAGAGQAVSPEVRILAATIEGLAAAAFTGGPAVSPPHGSGLVALPATVPGARLLDAAQPHDFEARFKNWLEQLRCGRRVAAMTASASRALQWETAGYPRTYVEIAAGSGPSPAALLQALQEGRSFISSGPFLRLSASGVGPGGTVRLGAGRRTSRNAARELAVRVQVLAPAWMSLDELRLYWNGRPHGAALPIPGRADGVRLDQKLNLSVSGDGFLVALVRGSAPLAPVVASPGPLVLLALTNPIWVDSDGDGQVRLSCQRDAPGPNKGSGP